MSLPVSPKKIDREKNGTATNSAEVPHAHFSHQSNEQNSQGMTWPSHGASASHRNPCEGNRHGGECCEYLGPLMCTRPIFISPLSICWASGFTAGVAV